MKSWVGCQVPAALVGGDINNVATAGFFCSADGLHSEQFNTLARGSVGREGGSHRITRIIAAQLAHSIRSGTISAAPNTIGVPLTT